MGCMADYSEEDLRLMKSVREDTLKDVLKIIDKQEEHKFHEDDDISFIIKEYLKEQIEKELGEGKE
jgi:hypothetical protein